VSTVLLSGDHPDVTEAIGRSVGVDEAIGGCTPEAKARWLEGRDDAGFVGDGLNDGPGLAAARVGLAMFSGVPSSLWIADGVVTRPALAPVVAAVAGARATRDAVRSNLIRSILYNIVAVAAAMAGLVNPLVAAILMPLSSGLVIAGALTVPRRLERLEKQWTSS
jgi:P-type E1-E2 ATPase